MQFSPTVTALTSSLGLEIFFALFYIIFWMNRKTEKVNLYLALWFICGVVYTISRLLQFYPNDISQTPYYGKIGAVTHFLVIWIVMLFVNAYTNYKPRKHEKNLWVLVIFIPIIILTTTEVFLTSQPVQRQTIFNENFYGAYQGVYYLPLVSIRLVLLSILFHRLFQRRSSNGHYYILIGFACMLLFSINDIIVIFGNFVWIRVYDFIFLPLGIAYAFELLIGYNKMYNRLESLVEERTVELISTNKKLQEEIQTRNQAERESFINKEKFFGIYNAVNEVIFMHDAKSGAIIDVNDKMLEVFKCTREQALKLSVSDISENIPPYTQEEANNYIKRACNGEEVLFEWRSKDLSGSVFWSEINMRAADIDNTKYVLVSLRDVSKRKETETELNIYQLHLEELVNKRTAELDRAIMEQLSLNEALQAVNEQLKIQRNELINALENLKIAQTQIVESEKMAALGILTAGIAHEINNPLNYLVVSTYSLEAVINDLQTVVDKELNKIFNTKVSEIETHNNRRKIEQFLEELKKINGYIARGTDRITEIIKGLRLFARSDNEVKHEINIHEHIDAVIVMLEHQIGNRIQLIRQYGEIPKYKCFPGKLGQVFMNLLMNSIQAIKNTGNIWVRTELSNDKSRLLISVKDTGYGIPDGIKEKIFEPFFTTKEVGEGTGLGLSIVFGIINEHKGKITVESKEHEGTEMIISLPL